MTQRKSHSGVETVINVGSGYFIAMILNVYLLPNYVEGIAAQSIFVAAWIGLVYTGTSMIRSYIWRRIFTHFTEGERLDKPYKQNSRSIDMQNQSRCKVEEKLTEELLNINSVGLSYAKDVEKETHLKSCDHPNCKMQYEARAELGLNNNTFEQFAKDFGSDDD